MLDNFRRSSCPAQEIREMVLRLQVAVLTECEGDTKAIKAGAPIDTFPTNVA